MAKAKKENTHKYEYHGSMATVNEVKEIINHVHDCNLRLTEDEDRVPVCVWGLAGIGKTAIMSQIAKERGIGFKYFAPAQFEEMGDLLGMPSTGMWMTKGNVSKIIDKDLATSYENAGWIRDITRPNQTVVAPPSFVPNIDLGDNEEGILLIDDANRAIPNIINGLMQLIQKGELATWKLPRKWTIVMTANPEGGEYQVNSFETAQLTRLLHISMKFDEKEWAKWAVVNNIDGRLINFVLKYPEVIHGDKTNARTIVLFSKVIKSIDNLKNRLGFVLQLAKGLLDDETATAFTTFINDDLSIMITPEQIINSKNFDKEVAKDVVLHYTKGSAPRVDIIGILSSRLVMHCIEVLEGDLTPSQIENLKSYIKIESIPNDIRLNMAQELTNSGKLKTLMSDPIVGKLLLKRM
jgi:MoxR-like ATPase